MLLRPGHLLFQSRRPRIVVVVDDSDLHSTQEIFNMEAYEGLGTGWRDLRRSPPVDEDGLGRDASKSFRPHLPGARTPDKTLTEGPRSSQADDPDEEEGSGKRRSPDGKD